MSDELHLLWLARMIPLPLNAGDRVYTARLAEAVQSVGARVTFVGLSNPDAAMSDLDQLGAGVEWTVVDHPPVGIGRALASTLPLVTARFSPSAFRLRVRELLQSGQFDAVVIDNYAAGWALDELPRRGRVPPLVYVAHNFETGLAREIAQDFRGNPAKKFALQLNALKIARLERRLQDRCDLIVALTDTDRACFAKRKPTSPMLVIPPGYSGTRVKRRTIDATVPRRVAMVGSVRWIAKQMNVAAFLEAADHRFAEAGIGLDIIGDVPEEFRLAWEPRVKATTFRGFVDHLEPELGGVRLGLSVEATGGGFKLKLLDYVFHRVPVAAFSESFEGIPEAVAQHFLVADDMADLASKVIAAIDNFARLNAMQEACFAAASGHFDWPANGRRLFEAIGEIRASKP